MQFFLQICQDQDSDGEKSEVLLALFSLGIPFIKASLAYEAYNCMCWSISNTESHVLNQAAITTSTAGDEGQTNLVLSGGESHPVRQGKGITLQAKAVLE